MNVKELMAYAKRNKMSLSNAVFANVYELNDDVKRALLQEFASLFDDSNEEDLIDNLKEYHEDLFEDEEDC